MRFCGEFKPTNPGSKKHVLRSPKIRHDGTIELIENGYEDLQEFYNAQEAGCDLGLIIDRIRQGDESALNAWTPMYGDFTKAPKTLAEYMQYQLDIDSLFSSLPVELRNKYDNSVAKFSAVAGEKEWLDNCMPYFSDEAKAYFVKPDESEKEVSE